MDVLLSKFQTRNNLKLQVYNASKNKFWCGIAIARVKQRPGIDLSIYLQVRWKSAQE
jgi:hypothetical protein